MALDDGEYATALVAFFVEQDEICYAGCCRVKLTVGAKYDAGATLAPLEVSAPIAYKGPEPPYDRFRAIEQVYRQYLPDAAVYGCNASHVAGHSEQL